MAEDVTTLQQHWEKLKVHDAARQDLVEKLFSRVRELEDENKTLNDDVEGYKFSQRTLHREFEKQSTEISNLRDKSTASPFIVVLIDGDNTLFTDKLVKAGIDGGHQAAQNLSARLEAYVERELEDNMPNKIIVRIYFNKSGLLRTYVKARIIPGEDVGENFIIGFNREKPLMEFIDVGHDKEAADNKIKDNLNLFWGIQQCRHIMLAGSADKGYVSFLRQYRTGAGVRERLTLVESVPFPRDFEELSPYFRVTRFDKIFRDDKVTIEEPSAWPSLKSTAAQVAAAAPFIPVLSFPQKTSPKATNVVPATVQQYKAGRMCFNKHGQRIDEPLPPCDAELMRKFQKKGICNRAILSKCEFTSSQCRYNHDVTLTPREKIALRHVARLSKCNWGPECDDRHCVAGHQCSFGSRCAFTDCKFGPEGHNFDSTVAEVY